LTQAFPVYPKNNEHNLGKADIVLGIDWTQCELIERVPGKVSGRPVVRSTILADTIVQDTELGSPLEEIQENYPDLSLTVIQQLISFARLHHEQRVR
jgi:uncharacterized protein (DUF433 family)